jgi:hypothetical protein
MSAIDAAPVNEWPGLPYALSPFEPEWGNVPLYLTSRGLTTSPVPAGLRTFDVEIDLVDHALVVRSSDGRIEHRPLGGSVAEFYNDVTGALRRMDIDVAISTLPSEVADPIPFPDDRTHDTYDPEQVARFFRALSMTAVVLKEHRARFRGRSTPVHFFWGSFDLALTRFSGRPVEPPPDADVISRAGGDAEQICAGWWPGNERLPFAAFYAYAYPAQEGVAELTVEPSSAAWNTTAREYLLEYDAARAEPDPRAAILRFLASTYAGAAALMGWDSSLTQVEAPTSAGG